MSKLIILCITILLANRHALSQTLFVDALRGDTHAKGTVNDPLQSLEAAIAIASQFSGKEPITIKVYPGIYLLKNKALISAPAGIEDTLPYTIEAAMMPDDADWQPASMPVIQSVSPNNSNVQFTHCEGFTIAKNNVHLKGLKFLGNSNPEVMYYYPVSRQNESYKGLYVTQCYFIGEKNSAAIQGAIWAQGADTQVEHSIFYNCKNALLLFRAISGFSLTHSIIYGSYESAVWFGPFDSGFIFENNVVANGNFFWVRPENTVPKYQFKNSIIAGNKEYLGHYGQKGLVAATKNEHVETNINKKAKLIFSEVTAGGFPKDYLNLAAGSEGKELNAGIFKKPRK